MNVNSFSCWLDDLADSVSIAYPIGAAFMSPLDLEDNVVVTISIILNTMQIWKQIGKHFKPYLLTVSQIPALLFGM